MGKSRSRHARNRAKRAQVAREKEADRIMREIEMSYTQDEKRKWGVEEQTKLEADLERQVMEQTLVICEDCLRVTGFQGLHRWRMLPCDICGDNEWSNVFGPNDNLILGDVYENDQSDVTKLKDEADDKQGMLICNVCSTNWDSSWGIYCGKCKAGTKHVQYIPKEQRGGATEKVCDTCFAIWAEPDGSTTCSKCDYGKPSYRLIQKAPPNVAPVHSNPPFSKSTAKRTWVPDWDGPRGPQGGIQLIPKEASPVDPDLDDVDDHLYSVNG